MRRAHWLFLTRFEIYWLLCFGFIVAGAIVAIIIIIIIIAVVHESQTSKILLSGGAVHSSSSFLFQFMSIYNDLPVHIICSEQEKYTPVIIHMAAVKSSALHSHCLHGSVAETFD